MSVFAKAFFAVGFGGFMVGNTGIALWLTGSLFRAPTDPASVASNPLPLAFALIESSIGFVVFATYVPAAVLVTLRLVETTGGIK